MDLHRRQFTFGLIAIAAANHLGGTPGAVAVTAESAIMHSARQVGAAYVRLRPHEAGRAWLVSALDKSLSRADAQANPLHEKLQAVISNDFAAGRTVRLDGWVLSETECRLCALHLAV